jgi:hypothetical protein
MDESLVWFRCLGRGEVVRPSVRPSVYASPRTYVHVHEPDDPRIDRSITQTRASIDAVVVVDADRLDDSLDDCTTVRFFVLRRRRVRVIQ